MKDGKFGSELTSLIVMSLVTNYLTYIVLRKVFPNIGYMFIASVPLVTIVNLILAVVAAFIAKNHSPKDKKIVWAITIFIFFILEFIFFPQETGFLIEVLLRGD